MWIMNDDERGMVKAQMDYCGNRGWGLNQAAIVVLNTMLAGARDGWFFSVKRHGLNELEFLRWVDELRPILGEIGLHVEPGVYIKRRLKLVRGEVRFVAKKHAPVRLAQSFVLFVGASEETVSTLADCYYVARQAKGRMFEVDGSKHHPEQERAEELLGSILGVPDYVIQDYKQAKPGLLNYVAQSRLHITKEMYENNPWAKYLCWDVHDDPFDLMFDSVSRRAAKACYDHMKGFPRWHPSEHPGPTPTC
jgi:hypothetical protein